MGISTVELKQILLDIKEHGPKVGVRFRLLGQMWQSNFVHILLLTENRVFVNDEQANKLVSIDFNDIVQFEIDNAFKTIDPHFHYDVVWGKNSDLSQPIKQQS